ncbi:hypothetical protein GWI33_007000 [Rhynchophorus ferrugineus]|uniref:DNA/RNA non-specific endonuclease domain-containing protein n=1 Tax=Rhynchophorus ferrugineus TaxID=354439 RepID=A0A834IEZ2_RHYFE|nr:hypothetical protein GWI33_007000 [Rhynchophorus ferrugineus]
MSIVFYGFSLSIGCRRLYTNDTHLPVPFYQDGSRYNLAELHNGYLNLFQNQQVLFICPGAKNYLKIANQTCDYFKANATCVASNKLKITGNQFNINDMFCTKSVRADVKETRRRCNSGYIYEIGYNVTARNWIPLIKICHVNTTGNTLYTSHMLGTAMLNVSTKITRISFSLAGFNTNIPVSISYNKAVQRIRFGSQLRSPSLGQKYVNNTSYLARGHLTPHADFSMASSQVSTYYYLNTAPTWQSLNAGNWKSVEYTVRKLAKQHGNLHVITGTFGTLKYPDIMDNPTEIYLTGNEIPVPKYIWKIAYEPVKLKAIVFVMLNDPFIINNNKYSHFCSDVCRDNGFSNTGWRENAKGLVWCCSYDEFEQIVKYRLNLNVRDTLEFKKT